MKQTQITIRRKTLFVFKTVKERLNNIATDPTTTTFTITVSGILHK